MTENHKLVLTCISCPFLLLPSRLNKFDKDECSCSIKYASTTSSLSLCLVDMYLQIPSGVANCSNMNLLISNTFKTQDTLVHRKYFMYRQMHTCMSLYCIQRSMRASYNYKSKNNYHNYYTDSGYAINSNNITYFNYLIISWTFHS